MKELIECKDLRHHARFSLAYMGLIGHDYHIGSLADVAFEMRDATKEGFHKHLSSMIPLGKSLVKDSTASDWIRACVLAWEAAHE